MSAASSHQNSRSNQPKVVAADSVPASDIWVHDEKSVNGARILSDFWLPDFPIPTGVLTASEAPVYEDLLLEQEEQVIAAKGKGDVSELLRSGETWTIR